MLDICNIIGVYIDNSINAVNKLKKKYINIEMYMDNHKMIISISNNYVGSIDIDKIYNAGYTSNGNGHGYGLVLVKEIVNKNKKLNIKSNLSKDTFSQKLIIEI